MEDQSPENILRAQAAVEEKVGQALDVRAIPIVIGQNCPCGSYAIAKPNRHWPYHEKVGTAGSPPREAHFGRGGQSRSTPATSEKCPLAPRR